MPLQFSHFLNMPSLFTYLETCPYNCSYICSIPFSTLKMRSDPLTDRRIFVSPKILCRASEQLLPARGCMGESPPPCGRAIAAAWASRRCRAGEPVPLGKREGEPPPHGHHYCRRQGLDLPHSLSSSPHLMWQCRVQPCSGGAKNYA